MNSFSKPVDVGIHAGGCSDCDVLILVLFLLSTDGGGNSFFAFGFWLFFFFFWFFQQQKEAYDEWLLSRVENYFPIAVSNDRKAKGGAVELNGILHLFFFFLRFDSDYLFRIRFCICFGSLFALTFFGALDGTGI